MAMTSIEFNQFCDLAGRENLYSQSFAQESGDGPPKPNGQTSKLLHDKEHRLKTKIPRRTSYASSVEHLSEVDFKRKDSSATEKELQDQNKHVKRKSSGTSSLPCLHGSMRGQSPASGNVMLGQTSQSTNNNLLTIEECTLSKDCSIDNKHDSEMADGRSNKILSVTYQDKNSSSKLPVYSNRMEGSTKGTVSKSPVQAKETESCLSVTETSVTSETQHRSSVCISEKRTKTNEKRNLKSDSTYDATARTTTTTAATNNNTKSNSYYPSPVLNGKPKHFYKKIVRAKGTPALPKLPASEERFNVRKKIEQLKKWREKQLSEEQNKLSPQTEISQSKDSLPPFQTQITSHVTDFTKILKENINHSCKNSSEQLPSRIRDVTPVTNSKTSFQYRGIKNNAHRPVSSTTWKTWRNVNDSYAYSDVNDYIEENELMPPERAEWIRAWICDVERALRSEGDDIHEKEKAMQLSEIVS